MPPNAFAERSLSGIREEMDKRYASDVGPYRLELAWDRARHEVLKRAVVMLADQWLVFEPTDGDSERRVPTTGLTLDIGCGEAGIADYWPHKNIVGLELSAVAVEKARAKHPDVAYVAGAIEEFTSERKFDTVVAVETIEHWSDVDRGLEAVKSVLAPGGSFVVTTPNRDSLHVRVGQRLGISVPFCSPEHTHEFGYEELRELLASHGFDVVRSVGVGLAPYWALELEFGNRIRFLTDKNEEIARLLAEAGEHLPHLAFIQCHACMVTP